MTREDEFARRIRESMESPGIRLRDVDPITWGIGGMIVLAIISGIGLFT